MAGQQFEYAFDDIGNRTSAKTGGDASGGGLRTASYSANSLNQYVSRTNPNDVDVIGIANADATVTVNGQGAYRKGEYYRASVSVTNSGTNVFQAVSNLATLGASTDLTTGGLLVPKVNQTFAYDADGNLTNDSVFTYFWDAENRLISLTNNGAANQGFLRQTMTYDSTSRRVRLQVETNSGASFVTTRHLHFVNDGWNLVAELNATNHNAVNSFLWGADLSGTLGGAGGVGGLLTTYAPISGPCFFVSAANGNVQAVINGMDGTVEAHYEYGPYGELCGVTGSKASSNPFRWSTIYQDNESDLLYYGYRYLNAATRSWLTRDPIAETGGVNLYAFVQNSPVNLFDVVGLCTPGCHRAGCDIKVLPAGYSPSTSEQIEHLAKLYTATEAFGMVLAAGQTGAAGLAGLEEAVAVGIGEGVGHGLSTPGEAIEHSAKHLIDKYGEHNGWVAWVFVSFEACESRCRIGRFFTGQAGYWRPLAGSTDWEQVSGPLPITGGFDGPKDALVAANRRCDERTAAFRRSNKMCN